MSDVYVRNPVLGTSSVDILSHRTQLNRLRWLCETNTRPPYRILLSIPSSERKKARGMNRRTANLSRIGASILRDWSSKDPPINRPETMKHGARNREELKSKCYFTSHKDD